MCINQESTVGRAGERTHQARTPQQQSQLAALGDLQSAISPEALEDRWMAITYDICVTSVF